MGILPLQPRAALLDAPVGEDRCCGDVTGAVSGQERDYTGNLLRLSHSPKRYGGIQLRHRSRILHRREVDGSGDRSWTHSGDEDIVRGEFDARGTCEHAHATFGKAISRIAG